MKGKQEFASLWYCFKAFTFLKGFGTARWRLNIAQSVQPLLWFTQSLNSPFGELIYTGATCQRYRKQWLFQGH